MGLIKTFKSDFKNFWKWMPNEIKVYEDKKTGIEAVEINNPPNPYVPEKIRWLDDKKKGISKFHLKKMNQKNLLILRNKRGLAAGGLLGVIFGVAAFWILLKWLLIAGIVGTGTLFASPLLLIVIALGAIWFLTTKK